MKKQKKKNPTSKPKHAPQAQVAPKPSRRTLVSSFGYALGAAVLLGGAGFWGFGTVQAAVAERDLTRIGQGTPTIVQVHDTQCSTCIALQQQVRIALDDFDDDALDYRVADLRSDDGSAFAARFGAGHSTLLFFDAQGALSGRLVGPNDSTTLSQIFAAHRNVEN